MQEIEVSHLAAREAAKLQHPEHNHSITPVADEPQGSLIPWEFTGALV